MENVFTQSVTMVTWPVSVDLLEPKSHQVPSLISCHVFPPVSAGSNIYHQASRLDPLSPLVSSRRRHRVMAAAR